MSNVIDEFLIYLGFDADTKGAEDFSDAMEGVKEDLQSLATVFVATAGAVFGFSKIIAGVNDNLGKNAKAIGLQVEELDALGFAAEQTGTSADQLTGTLAGLVEKANDVRLFGGESAVAFDQLGISITDGNGALRDAQSLLLDAAEGYKRLSDAGKQSEALAFAKRLGFDERQLLLLQEGRAGIEKLTAEARRLGVTTAEDAKKSAQFNDEMNRIGRIVRSIATDVGATLLPIITEIAESVREWFFANREIVNQRLASFMKTLTNVAQTFWGILQRITAAVWAVLEPLGGFETLMSAITGGAILFGLAKVGSLIMGIATAFKAVTLASAPVWILPAAIGAIAAAVVLLLEDLWGFANGADSVFADFLKWIGFSDAEISALRDTFGEVFAVIGAVVEAVGPVFQTIFGGVVKMTIETVRASLMLLVKGVRFLAQLLTGDFSGAWETASGLIGGVFDAIGIAITGAINQLKLIGKLVMAVFTFDVDAITGALDAIFDNFTDTVKTSVEAIVSDDSGKPAGTINPRLMENRKAAGLAGTSIQNSNTNIGGSSKQDIDIHIHGATDPAATGRSVTQSLQDAQRQAIMRLGTPATEG